MIRKLLDLLFPRYCVSCHVTGNYLCSNCFSKIQFLKTQYCPYCQNASVDGLTHPLCQKRFGLDGLISAVYYQGPIKALLKVLKYDRVADVKQMMAQIIGSFLIEEEDFYPKDTMVTSVPLHFFKKNFRGFNQAQILGEAMVQVLDLEFKPSILTRKRYTVSQTGLKKRERSENIEGAFAYNAKAGSITGKNMLLVDDVWTTGATIKECSKVLKQARAEKVWALTLARDEKKMI